jgi:hypothetical protein
VIQGDENLRRRLLEEEELTRVLNQNNERLMVINN